MILTEKAMLDTPLGLVTLVSQDNLLAGVYFEGHRRGPDLALVPHGDAGVLLVARRALEQYFAGTSLEMSIPHEPQGTPFQREVWRVLANIPVGHTRTYGQVALAVGRPTATRAVAAAIGANPLSILIPCHRVVGADGSLTGYSGGVERKEWLLRHEGVLV